MRRSTSVCGVALAVAAAACTTPPVAPGVPHDIASVVIAPYQAHDECVRLGQGDRLDWRYESTEPLAFNIQYRQDNAMLSPVVREHSTTDSGTFEARLAQDYCLTWESGPPGAIISYRVLVRPAPR
jgi:hypothetical protein